MKFETYNRDKFFRENMIKSLESSRDEFDSVNKM